MLKWVTSAIMLFFVSVSLADAFEVPDTGITECFDANGTKIFPCPAPGQPYYGQDGNYVHNGMSFTDNHDGTLKDNVTGLVWQTEANGTSRTWDQAVSYCASLNTNPAGGLGGHASGWRLPALVELNTILDLSVNTDTGAAAINPLFTGTAAAGYWTSTVDPDNAANAWELNFGSTEDGIVAKSATDMHVRCVWTGVTP